MSRKPTYEELEKEVKALKEVQATLEKTQTALRDSEEKYRKSFESITDSITVTRIKDGLYLYVNDGFCLQTGYSREEVIGKTPSDINLYAEPVERDRFIGILKEYGKAEDVVVSFRRKSGEIYYSEFSAKPISYAGEACLLAQSRDITDRKRAEEALLKSKEKFRDLFDNAPLGYVEYDQEGRIKLVNQTYLDMLGYKQEEMLGKFVWDFYLEKSEAKEQILTKLEGRKPPGSEFTRSCRRKDGSVVPVLVEDRFLFDDKKRVMRVRCTYQDITERKKAEKALSEKASELQKRNQFIQTILDNLPIGLAINYFDKGMATYMNKRFEEIYGWPEEELKNVSEFFEKVYPDPDYREKLQTQVLADINSGDPERMKWDNLEATHKDGSKGIISAKNIPIFEQNFMISTVQDITERKKAEKALRKKDAMLANIASQVPGMLYQFLMRPDGAYAVPYSSKGVKDIFGCSPEDVKDDFGPILNAIHPEDRNEILRTIDESKENLSQWQCEYRVQVPDEPIKWIYGNSIPEEKADGSILWSGYNVDITDRKQMEDDLRKNEERYRRLSENSPAVVYQFKMDESGKFTFPYVSEALKKTIGVSPEEAVKDASRILNMVHPEDREKLYSGIMKSADNLEPYHETFRGIKDGEVIWVEARSVPESMPDGSVLWDGFLLDITTQKKAEEALLESEKRFKNLAEMLPEALFESDVNMNLTYVNQRALSLFGYSEEDFKNGLKSFDMLVPEQRESALKKLEQRFRGENLPASEYCGLKKDGTEFPILLHAVPILQDKTIKGARGVIVDLSEIKKLESELQQAHKMEAIGTLAGGIAHEFNNVLAIIMGNAELAIDDVPDWNPAKESLKEILTASFRAKEVVQQILSFARKTMTDLKPLEINTIVKESLKLMRASIPTMVDIQRNIPSKPRMILGDPTEIHQIVINLCTNAAHAMKRNGGVLEVGISEVNLSEKDTSRYEDLSAGDFVRLTVKDSGEGISPEVLEKVFEPYFTTKEFGAGSGMGLAVVYGIVKKCKGAISIESTVGEGTTVEVLFPKIGEEAPAKEKKEDALPKGNERILLVDDDPSIVTMISQMLERFGYTVSSMTESTSALEQFKSTPSDFDLVITDMSMPKMSGDQLAAELIKVRKDIPILLCTGHSDAVNEKRAKEIGIKGFAMKPLDTGKLARVVRKALDGQ